MKPRAQVVVQGGEVQRRVAGLIGIVDVGRSAGAQQLVQQARLAKLRRPVQRRLALLQW